MNELVIKTHDFELAKSGVKEFSQKKAEELEIDTVKTGGGLLGFGNHKVTGYEFNSRLSTIQQHLIDLNTTNNKTIKEFGQVYSALEALDKDYIKAILISIKATEKTSERIQATQEQIKKIVDDQKKTLEVLKRFKQRLDGYDHLGDIDRIWSDFQKWHNEITTLSNSISSAMAISKANAQKAEDLKIVLKATEKKLNDLSKQLNQQIVKLEAIIVFTSELEKIVHLQDIDGMWDSLLNAHNSLTKISNELSSFKDTASKQQSDIETLLFFMEGLSSCEHLNDVDDIWTKSEEHHLHLAKLVKTSEGIQSNVSSNAKNIEELKKHKNHLCQIKHLEDVDSIWETTEDHSYRLKELKQQDENTLELVQANKISIDEFIEYKSELCSITHLNDVDDIWTKSEEHHLHLAKLVKTSEGIQSNVSSNAKNIEELKKHKNHLCQIKHLDDIDSIWETTENHSSRLKELKQQDENTLELVQANKISIDEFIEYKSELCSITHLNDVDDIWTKSEEHHLHLAKLVKTSEGIQSNVSSNAKNIEELKKHKNHLCQIKHLDDIDSIWETTENHSSRLKELKQQDENTLELVQANKISIDELTEYKSKLCSITHLNDVDDIWNSSELYSNQLPELKRQSDETKSIVQTNKENTDATIASVVEKYDIAAKMLTKKIKYAYLLAGGSLGLVIIELIVILLKVI